MLYFGLLLVTIALAMAAEQEPKTAEQKLILDGGFTGERKPDASAQALADSVCRSFPPLYFDCDRCVSRCG